MIKDYRILGLMFVIVAGLTAASIVKIMQPEYTKHQKDYYNKLGEKDFTVQVNQVNVQTASGMIVDRCTSCHLGATNKEAASFPHPLAMHPPIVPGMKKDPHDLNKMGCVVCHDGNGRGLAKNDAHGELDFWIAPRLKGKMAQSNCSKCHATERDLAGATLLNKGRRLFIEKECWACHTIAGVSTGTKGPNLSDAGNKFNVHYLRESIEKPKANIESSKMPKFDWVDSDKDDVEALVVYLKSQRLKNLRSADKAPIEFKANKAVWKAIPKKASAEYGKEIFHAKAGNEAILGGCINCHSYKTSAPIMKNGKMIANMEGGNIGPELTYAFKTRGIDFLKDHIKNPASHVVDSIMPKFNTLTDVELESLTLFLKSMNTEVKPRDPKMLYAAHCASCHGNDFDGQGRLNGTNKLLDPLPRNFRHQFIKSYKARLPISIKKGIKGTDMPPWEGLLTDAEINGLVDYLEAETFKDGKEFVRPDITLPKIGDIDELTQAPIIAADSARGEMYFMKNCTACHGKLANGKGPVAYDLKTILEKKTTLVKREGKKAQSELAPILPRNLISQEFMGKNGITDERLFQSILMGVPGTPMPMFDRQLSRQSILDIIAYLRSISKPNDKTKVKSGDQTKAQPADKETRSRERLKLPKIGDKDRMTQKVITAPDTANGRRLFMHACIICHTKRGNGQISPSIDWSKLMKESTSDEEFYKTTLNGSPNSQIMPAYNRKLSDQDVLDIMGYLKALKKKEARINNENK